MNFELFAFYLHSYSISCLLSRNDLKHGMHICYICCNIMPISIMYMISAALLFSSTCSFQLLILPLMTSCGADASCNNLLLLSKIFSEGLLIKKH